MDKLSGDAHLFIDAHKINIVYNLEEVIMEEKKLLNEEELRKIAGGDAVDRFF